MSEAATSILDLPYGERQLISVVDDQSLPSRVVPLLETAAPTAIVEASSVGVWPRVLEPFLSGGLVTAAYTTGWLSIHAWEKNTSESDTKVRHIGMAEAKLIKFPHGHPRNGNVYVGHPLEPSVYFNVADFHKAVFEHKFCEAIELLMSLGATNLRVEHMSGWSKDFSTSLNIPIGNESRQTGVYFSTNKAVEQKILYEANLRGSKPILPKDLVWFHHEPVWQQIANGRLKYGLRDFTLNVSNRDDSGINADVKAFLIGAGFDIGGDFEDFRSTDWRIEGQFCKY